MKLDFRIVELILRLTQLQILVKGDLIHGVIDKVTILIVVANYCVWLFIYLIE